MALMKNEESSPSSSAEIYKRLFPYIRPYRFRLGAGILCGILQGGATFGLVVALYWGLGLISGDEMHLTGIAALDEVEGSTAEIGIKRLILTVAVLPLVTIFQGMMLFGGRYLIEWVGNRVVADLRSLLFGHIHALPMQFFSKSRSGELISRITNDTNLLTQLVSNVLGDLIREPFTLIGAVAAMFYIDWRLSLIARHRRRDRRDWVICFPSCRNPSAAHWW